MNDIQKIFSFYQQQSLENFGYVGEHISTNGVIWRMLYKRLGKLECRLCANPELWSLLDHNDLFGVGEGCLYDFNPQYPGAAWIIFAFTGRNAENMDAPLRHDGFVLFCQWRHSENIKKFNKGEPRHDPRLPLVLTALADRIRGQFMRNNDMSKEHPEDYWLWLYAPLFGPATDDQGHVVRTPLLSGLDSLALCTEDDNECGGHAEEPQAASAPPRCTVVASAWGALASGLYLAIKGRQSPTEWPFSSISYDFGTGSVAGVDLLERKMSAILDFKPTRFWVSPVQGRKGGAAEQAKNSLNNQLNERIKVLQAKFDSCDKNNVLRDFLEKRIDVIHSRLETLENMQIVSPQESHDPVRIAEALVCRDKDLYKYKNNDYEYTDYEHIDFDKALELYTYGCFSLGMNFYLGGKMKQDDSQAVIWFRKAAKQGHAGAQYRLGMYYYLGDGLQQDYRQAEKYFRKAAEQHHADAQYRMGWCYGEGNGVKQDHVQAAEWFSQAAQQGHTEAQYMLGGLYYWGQGVKQDYSQAVKWYRSAAESDDEMAIYALGHCYEKGFGVEPDYEQAAEYYLKLSSSFNFAPQAQCALGRCHEKLEGASGDYSQAIKWYLCAAESGDELALYALGRCYEEGLGIKKDHVQAKKYYTKAVKELIASSMRGEAYAEYALGVCYEEGRGVEKNWQLAVEHYLKAAKMERESTQSCTLACCFCLALDFTVPVMRCRFAAEQGDADAQFALGCFYENGVCTE